MFSFKKNIGLALGGGSVKGLAHIGVLKVLEEKKYKIKCIAGTSSGSLVGGLYAFFQDAKKVENIFLEQDLKTLIRAFSDIDIRKGVIKGGKVKDLIESYVGNVKIEDLGIKFVAVATDIIKGKKVVIDKGSLSNAIVASGSLPFLFKPTKLDGSLLLDGGLVEPVPVRTVKDMGCRKVLAVDLNTGESIDKDFKILARSSGIMVQQLTREQTKKAWKIIVPKFEGSVSFLKFVDGQKIINKGEMEARKVLG